MKIAVFALSLIVSASDGYNQYRVTRNTNQACNNADRIESGVHIAFTYKEAKTESRKSQAITILNWFRDWLNDFGSRQSFKAQNGELNGFMWVGSMVQNSGLRENVVPDFIDEIQTSGMPEEIYYEFLHTDAMQSFGIILTTRGLQKAQQAVRKWSAGQAYKEQTGSKNSKNLSICYLAYGSRKQEVNDNEAGACDYNLSQQGENPSGNVGEYLKAFNPSLDFSKSVAGQPYCYSEGVSPNFKPSKNSNGTCATYFVRQGSTCGALIAKYTPLTEMEIEQYNKNTYGWNGCKYLQVGQAICVSEGNPPRPTPYPKAECGPLAPGDLHNKECTNKACCSDFGFCGLTSEFCDVKNEGGAPGTRGCYSNCGYGTLPSRKASNFNKVAYWLDTDGGLYLDPGHVSGYDIVQYAFATITNDMTISVGTGFSKFQQLKCKKVISFGGWMFSTSPSTYNISRKAVSDQHRDKFARTVVDFLKKHSLDGVDFDWEYPEAPDIPNIPAGTRGDGERYAKLLQKIKESDRSKSVSIAIPASYWYLKGIPLAKFDSFIDYYISMNYDYVGQWDYGKGNTGIGCHNDRSSTEDAIKMIVKSGIDTTKVYGGLANYGRSFKLSDKNCKSYKCPFTGPQASARSGEMTDTPGFLSIGEINELQVSERNFNSTSKCFYAVYNNGADWVAWMKESDLKYTEEWYKNDVGLGGSVLWVVNYYKTTYSESPDSLNCYYEDGVPICDGDVLDSASPKSHKRDLNKKTDLNDVFGRDYGSMLSVRRLFYYSVELALEIKADKVSQDFFKLRRSCSEKVSGYIEDHYSGLSKKVKDDLEALARVLMVDDFSGKRNNYDEAVKRLGSNSFNAKNYDKICGASSITHIIMFHQVQTAAVTSMFENMRLSEPNMYRTIISTPTPTLTYIDPGYAYATDVLQDFDAFRNELTEATPTVGTPTPTCNSDYRPTPTNDGLPEEEFEEHRFERLPDNPTYPLGGVIRYENADDYYNAINRMEGLMFNHRNMLNIIESGNAIRELGTSQSYLYVVNSAGNSPGVACNALLYMLSPEGRNLNTTGGLSRLTYGSKKSRSFLKKSATWNTYEKDEYPPHSMEQGMSMVDGNEVYTCRVACVEKEDNRNEGVSSARFINGSPPSKTSSTPEAQTDWSHAVPGAPGQQGIGDKRGKLTKGTTFYVALNLPKDTDCNKYLKIPKQRIGSIYVTARDGVTVECRRR